MTKNYNWIKAKTLLITPHYNLPIVCCPQSVISSPLKILSFICLVSKSLYRCTRLKVLIVSGFRRNVPTQCPITTLTSCLLLMPIILLLANKLNSPLPNTNQTRYITYSMVMGMPVFVTMSPAYIYPPIQTISA